MEIIKYRLGDILELKKSHPCGGNRFRVIRVGGVMRIECIACSHIMEIDRLKLEKATKKIVFREGSDSE